MRRKLGQKLNVLKSTSHHPLWMHHQRLTVLDTVGLELSHMGFIDGKNVYGRLRSGYELVRADEYSDSDYPVVR